MRQHGARWWRLTIVAASVTGLLLSGLGAEFFTTQSNAVVIGYFSAAVALGWRRDGRTPAPRMRGATTAWILITGVANQLVLAGTADPAGFLLAPDPTTVAADLGNLLVHYVVPAMVLVDWIAWRPGVGLRWRDALLWIAYPLLYLAVIASRGALFPQIDERYPYPFLDPGVTGWPGPSTALPVVVILMVAIPFAVVGIGKLRQAVSRSPR